MKMKKMLAALLAVFMLLTMLPISVFAAGVDYDIVIDSVGFAVNGEYIDSEEEAVELGFGTAWEFDAGILDLFEGNFKITSEFPLNGVYTSEDVTIVDADFEANFMGNAGVIAGGTIDANIKNIGTIIFYTTFEGGVENDGTIEGGTFNWEVDNNGTIEGGTFDGYVDNFSTIEGGTFNNGVYSEGVIDAGTFNAFVDNYGEITGGTFLSESSIYGNMPNEDADVTYLVKDPAEEDRTLVELYSDTNDGTMKVKVLFADEKAPLPQKVPVNLYYQEAAPCDLTFDDPLSDYDWGVLAQGNATKANGWLYTYQFPYVPLQYNDAEEQGTLRFDGYYYYSIDVPKDYEVVEYGLDEENGWNTVTLKYTGKIEKPVVEETIEETYDIVVRVKFDGVDEDEIDFVNAQLLKNGEAYKKAVKVDENDEWTHRWRDVDDSRKIEWTVTADPIDGYNMDIVHVRANYWTITLSPKNAAAEKVNPSTGADDFVGAAVALAVCSAACGAVLNFKK